MPSFPAVTANRDIDLADKLTVDRGLVNKPQNGGVYTERHG